MTVSYESLHPSDVFGGNLAPSTSANTKGSYLEFDASTAFAVDSLHFTTRFYTSSARQFLLDIATGAGGSEIVLVSNLLLQGASEKGTVQFGIPVPVGSGLRIALRAAQSGTGSVTIHCILHLIGGEAAHLLDSALAHTYGDVGASTDGTAVDPGGTASTKGSYVEITAATSTSNPIRWLIALARTQNASAAQAYMYDIATGAGGSETVIVPDRSLTTLSSGLYNSGQAGAVNIASGTRIAMRTLCGSNTNPDRINNFVLVGIEGTLPAGAGPGETVVVNRRARGGRR